MSKFTGTDNNIVGEIINHHPPVYFTRTGGLMIFQSDHVVEMYADMGVESLFAWTYRGGQGTVLAAPRAREVWDTIGKAYGQVLRR